MCIKSCEKSRRNPLNMADDDIESVGGGGGGGVGGGGHGIGGVGGINQNIQQTHNNNTTTTTNGNPSGITATHHHHHHNQPHHNHHLVNNNNNYNNMTSYDNGYTNSSSTSGTVTNEGVTVASGNVDGAERNAVEHCLTNVNHHHHHHHHHPNSHYLHNHYHSFEDTDDGVGNVYNDNGVQDDDSEGDMTASLPKALIVTGLGTAIFEDIDCKEEFENLFKAFDESVVVQYLKCFRRARVVFSTSLLAATARIHLHETELGGKTLKCYFAQPIKCLGSQPLLQPPKPVRQHLISPPASPPVGWEPSVETEPVINYDLLAAVATLSPGEAHELHPPTENQPGIVVHICEEPDEFKFIAKPKIIQTMRPDRVN